MTQTDLFGEPGLKPKQQQVAEQKREQESELQRVHVALEAEVRRFVATHPTFVGSELERAVLAKVSGATPGSPLRILRLLRQDGHLNYECHKKRTYTMLPTM